MADNEFAERLGYSISSGMRDANQKADIVAAAQQGFEAGIIAAGQSDECPYDPHLRCSDFDCGDGC